MNNAMASNLLNDSLQGLLVIFFEIIFNLYASFRQRNTSSWRSIDIVFRSQKRLKLLPRTFKIYSKLPSVCIIREIQLVNKSKSYKYLPYAYAGR